MIGLERQRQVVVKFRVAGQAADRIGEVGDRGIGMPERQLRAAAQEPRLAVIGGHFQNAVESRQRLFGLIPRELDGGDAAAGHGMIRLALERAEVFREGRVGLAHDLEQAAEREMGLRAVRVDLDRRLEPLAGRFGVSFLGLDLPQPDQGIHIIGVELESADEAVLGVAQAALQEVDSSQAMLRDRRCRASSDLLLERDWAVATSP